MIRKVILIASALAFVLAAASPAAAMCTPGKVEVGPKGKVTIELPHCDPPPQ